MYGTTGAWEHRTSPETRKDLMPPRPRLHSPNGEQSGEFHPPKPLSPCYFAMYRESRRLGRFAVHPTSPEADRGGDSAATPWLHYRNGESHSAQSCRYCERCSEPQRIAGGVLPVMDQGGHEPRPAFDRRMSRRGSPGASSPANAVFFFVERRHGGLESLQYHQIVLGPRPKRLSPLSVGCCSARRRSRSACRGKNASITSAPPIAEL